MIEPRTWPWFPATVVRERERDTTHIVFGVSMIITGDGRPELWCDGGYEGKVFAVQEVVASNNEGVTVITDVGERVQARPTIPEDAVADANFAQPYPLPVEIIGAIMNATIPSNTTLSAAVDADGVVHTMVLETAIGLYARYSAQWIRMTDITPIEQLDMVDVDPNDLDVYDAADQSGRSLLYAGLNPTSPGSPSAVQTSPATTTASALAASTVVTTVVISSAADLDEAIAFAATPAGAGSRWYVTRKARALGHTDPLPWKDDA